MLAIPLAGCRGTSTGKGPAPSASPWSSREIGLPNNLGTAKLAPGWSVEQNIGENVVEGTTVAVIELVFHFKGAIIVLDALRGAIVREAIPTGAGGRAGDRGFPTRSARRRVARRSLR